MKIIDAHMHYSRIQSFQETAHAVSKLEYTPDGLKKEMHQCHIYAAIAMGLAETIPGAFPDENAPNPMGANMSSALPENLYHCLGINPCAITKENRKYVLDCFSKQLCKPGVVGIKVYAGYYPFHVYDGIYQPFYDLAAFHKLPVVIHSGDTYSERGLLKYAHPLHVDELAVQRRDVRFVLAHMGDPWIMDGVEVTYKNDNVYMDLSGLIIGDGNKVKRVMQTPLLMDHFRRGILYMDNYDKLLFGSDWPLVALEPYIRFVAELIPEEHHEKVFFNNAASVFTRIDVSS